MVSSLDILSISAEVLALLLQGQPGKGRDAGVTQERMGEEEELSWNSQVTCSSLKNCE